MPIGLVADGLNTTGMSCDFMPPRSARRIFAKLARRCHTTRFRPATSRKKDALVFGVLFNVAWHRVDIAAALSDVGKADISPTLQMSASDAKRTFAMSVAAPRNALNE
jgi:hypothetical protein